MIKKRDINFIMNLNILEIILVHNYCNVTDAIFKKEELVKEGGRRNNGGALKL